MRAIYLANYFVAGSIAFSFLGWVASLHPITFRAVLCLLAATTIIWCLSWLLDFSLSSLKISVRDLQAYLIAAGAMFLVGLGVFLCT
jgi:4-hydroxybenzoate polyprenyltransferase